MQCIGDTVVESAISLILESCKHAKSSVGDKLKVIQFHPIIRNSVDSITLNNKLRLAPTRCSLDSHYVTNHTLTVRGGVITQSHAKSPGAPQTSTLSLCLSEQFNVMLGTVPPKSISYHLLSSTFSLSSARRFPNGLTRRAEGDTKNLTSSVVRVREILRFRQCRVLEDVSFQD